MRNFDSMIKKVLGEASYQQKYQQKKQAEKRDNLVAELEPEVRNQISLNFDKPTAELTLNNLEGRIVNLELRTGEKLRGIVQAPRDIPTDANALRIFSLDKHGVRAIPKKWITKASIGSKEVNLGTNVGGKKLGTNAKAWKVPGSGGNTYDVKTDGFGGWACTCPAFKWKKGDCKHITSIKEKMGEK